MSKKSELKDHLFVLESLLEDKAEEIEELRGKIEEIRDEIEKVETVSWPQRTKMYLHSNDEYTYGVGMDLGLEDDALNDFTYALAEVEFDVLVHKDGSYEIEKVNGRKLEEQGISSEARAPLLQGGCHRFDPDIPY